MEESLKTSLLLSQFFEEENHLRFNGIDSTVYVLGLLIQAAGGTITIPLKLLEYNPKGLTVERMDNIDGTVTFRAYHRT